MHKSKPSKTSWTPSTSLIEIFCSQRMTDTRPPCIHGIIHSTNPMAWGNSSQSLTIAYSKQTNSPIGTSIFHHRIRTSLRKSPMKRRKRKEDSKIQNEQQITKEIQDQMDLSNRTATIWRRTPPSWWRRMPRRKYFCIKVKYQSGIWIKIIVCRCSTQLSMMMGRMWTNRQKMCKKTERCKGYSCPLYRCNYLKERRGTLPQSRRDSNQSSTAVKRPRAIQVTANTWSGRGLLLRRNRKAWTMLA